MITRVTWRRAVAQFAQEVLLVLVAYVLYSVLRVAVEGSQERAFDNAVAIISLERATWLFHEAAVQQLVESVPVLAEAMRWLYGPAYLPLLGIAGGVVYWRDRALYCAYRNTLFISAAVGLVFFAAVPVAPPRMLPEYGFVDSVNGAFVMRDWKNDLAAVPSFHFGFTLLAALAVAHVASFRRWVCVAVAFVPALMLVAIVATANHFFVDAVIGTAVVMIAWRAHVWPLCAACPSPEVDNSGLDGSAVVAGEAQRL
jgi:hypothetical protein